MKKNSNLTPDSDLVYTFRTGRLVYIPKDEIKSWEYSLETLAQAAKFKINTASIAER